MGLYGHVAGGFGMPKMIEITDDNGNTLIGTVTDSEVVFDATRDDVKIGKIFASADGVQEGRQDPRDRHFQRHARTACRVFEIRQSGRRAGEIQSV